jgi:F420H(2)-dependent quinone reductase
VSRSANESAIPWWPAGRRAKLVARLALWLLPSPTREHNRRVNRIDAAWQRRLGRSLSSLVAGVPMLLLTTTGRRSGLSRTVALAYVVLDGAVYLVAGASGADRHPLWLENLRARAEVEIEVGWLRLSGRAFFVDEPERSRLWPRLTGAMPSIELYRARTERCIPVVQIFFDG